MIVTLFRSRLAPDVGDEYHAPAERMDQLARTMPGYISHKTFTAEDGERVTIVEFESLDAVKVWRMNSERAEAQRLGRKRFCSEYKIQTCEVLRQNVFKRP